MVSPNLSKWSEAELIAGFADPGTRGFATHEMCVRGEKALLAIRGILDGSSVDSHGNPYPETSEVFRCALVSARLMGTRARCLEALLRELVGRVMGICAAEAIQALVQIEWRDQETLLVLVEALEREADIAAEAANAIARSGNCDHPLVVERLYVSSRARSAMEWFGNVLGKV